MPILLLKDIIIDPSVRMLCCRPYQNHPRGCPNFNRKYGCPPEAPLFTARYNMSGKFFAIVNDFPLDSHTARMRKLHPDWTDRQLECCLYWQPKARKKLNEIIFGFTYIYDEYIVDRCPEAGGVNVTETLKLVDLALEWPPKHIVRQVAIAGELKL